MYQGNVHSFVLISALQITTILAAYNTHLLSHSFLSATSQFSPVQSLSRVRLFVTPWIAARQASLTGHQLPELTQTHVHWVGDAIQPSHPLLSPSPPAPNPSSIRVFSNESTLHMRWPKYWSFSFSISPSDEHPGLGRLNWIPSSESHKAKIKESPGLGSYLEIPGRVGHQTHAGGWLNCFLQF